MEGKPERVKEIEKSAGVQCGKVGEYSSGYDNWETWLCPFPDGSGILAQRYYTHVFARHSNMEIRLSSEEIATLATKLKELMK